MPIVAKFELCNFNAESFSSHVLSAKPLQTFEFKFPELEPGPKGKFTETPTFHLTIRTSSPEMELIAMDVSEFADTKDFQGKLDHHLAGALQREFNHCMIILKISSLSYWNSDCDLLKSYTIPHSSLILAQESGPGTRILLKLTKYILCLVILWFIN